MPNPSSSLLLAVITGGGTGIGREQALALSKIPGMVIIITGRRKEPLEETQSEIGSDKCHILSDCDTGDIASWKRIAALVTELGGELHFLGNTSGSFYPSGPVTNSYEVVDSDAIVAYNTSYVSGVQLSYHYLAPFLVRGAEKRGKPSVVINMSSSNVCLPRGMGAFSPFYHPVKCAMDAITRCAYGLYKDKNVLTFGLNPNAYTTEMLANISSQMGLTMDQLCAMGNPFPIGGNPADIGQISAALFRCEVAMEAGVSYIVLPVPTELLTSNGSTTTSATSSILYSASLHGPDVDELEYDVVKKACTKISKAFDCNGKVLPDDALERIRDALSKV